MMKTRKFYIPDCTWDIGALEDWLEHMAAKGWLFRGQKKTKAIFEKGDVTVCRVRLEPLSGEDERAEERNALYAKMGWEYLGTLGAYAVYRCTDSAAPEFHTDPVAANWARKKMLSTAWETVVEGWDGNRQLFTRVCRVRFSLLAGPLYEEWLDERAHDYPEAVAETLSDDRFDRTALCTYGEALYLQQEHYVFEVYARELPDLTGSLDAYAALLDAYTA